jgi:hypothetical protein
MSRRGIYRNKGSRSAAISLPAAWEIGDRSSFAGARARAMRGICLDLDLGSSEKAVLAVALDHMNADERWSCFASISRLAEEAGVKPATCWRAIGKADGKHILTKRAPRIKGSKFGVTHITIHPNYIADLRHSDDGNPNVGPTLQNNVADLEKLYRKNEKTISQKCEENLLQLTHFKESTSSIDVGKEGSRGRDGFPSHLERRKRGTREEIFLRHGSAQWAELEMRRGQEIYTAGACGGVGNWFDAASVPEGWRR